jgi:hypothetical protein
VGNEEQVKAWIASVGRITLASKVLLAAVKLFEAGGQDAQLAWEAVEKARAAHVQAIKRESGKWRRITGEEPEPQTEMEGMERPGPRGPKTGPKGLLGPKTSAGGEA